jgi:uncharacterized coiled-coil protein SlyX
VTRTPVKQLFATYFAPIGCGVGDSRGTDSPVLRRFELGAGVLETADLEYVPVEDVEATLREAISGMSALGKLEEEKDEAEGKVVELEKREGELEEAVREAACAITEQERWVAEHARSLQVIEDVLGKLEETILPDYERFVTTDPKTTELEKFLHRWLKEQLEPQIARARAALKPLYETPDFEERGFVLTEALENYVSDHPEPAPRAEEKQP